MALGDAEEIWVRHLDWDGNIRDEFRPMNPVWELRNNDANTISYDISLAEPTMRWGFVGPKRTVWEFWIGDIRLAAGIHSLVNTRRGEEVVHVQGKGYEWYIQNRHYPFDGRSGHINDYLGGTASDTPGFAYQALKDPAFIIDDLITKINARPNAVQIYYSPEEVGVEQGIRIDLADTESIYSKILTMSQSETGGFDFYIDQDRRLFLVAPHVFLDTARTDPSACVWIFDHFIHPEDLIESEFENSGPEGTHIMALGQGTSTRLVRSFGYNYEQTIFKRWDMTVDFPDVMSEAQLINLAQEHFSAGLYPQHNIPLTCKPNEIPDFWQTFNPGNAVWVRQNYEAQNIDGAYKMNTIRGRANPAGEIIVELDLEQVNAQGRPGTPQG